MTTTEPSEVASIEPGETAVQSPPMTPLVLDLGKRGKKTIRRLRKGRGPAMAEIMDVMEQVQAELGADAEGKALLPVVVLYGRKRRRQRGPWF